MAETTADCRARLPTAVYDLAMRLGVRADDVRAGVTLAQTGRMKRSREARSWIGFSATQRIATHVCAFDWRANAGPFGMISARDALEGDTAHFDILALGFIPLARAEQTPALVRGELMRYLAELAWAPSAILGNTTLRWRAEDPTTFAVSAGAGATVSEVFLTLDGDGRIGSAFAPDRPRSAAAPHLPTPWRGQFSDYRLHGGFWLPFAGEVAWEIAGDAKVYWQGRIARWEQERRA